MTTRPKPLKTWGRWGTEEIVRDRRGLVVKTTNHFEAVMHGIGSRRCKGAARIMIFSGGPECREYRYDTISDSDRERLEREIGAPFLSINGSSLGRR